MKRQKKYQEMTCKINLGLACDCKTKPKTALTGSSLLPSFHTPHLQSLIPPLGPERHNETISHTP